MSDDLVKQAEMRYQRRPASQRQAQNEEIIPLKNNLNTKPLPQTCPDSKQSLPPIRHHGNQDISVAISNLSTLKADDRPRTPRRRLATPINHDLSPLDDLQPKKACLPFIRCKINGKELKALLNTASPISTINRRAHELCSLPKSQPTEVNMNVGDDNIKLTIQIDEMGSHDLVLGMDLMSQNNCILDFKQKLLTYNGSKSTPFLSEDEIPLKYRNKPSLAASM